MVNYIWVKSFGVPKILKHRHLQFAEKVFKKVEGWNWNALRYKPWKSRSAVGMWQIVITSEQIVNWQFQSEKKEEEKHTLSIE